MDAFEQITVSFRPDRKTTELTEAGEVGNKDLHQLLSLKKGETAHTVVLAARDTALRSISFT